MACALVGAGNLARWAHLPVLQILQGLNLRAVHSTSGARGKSYGIRFGAAYAPPTISQILQTRRVDAVVITSRNQHHAAADARRTAGRQARLCRKADGPDREECRDLVQGVDESGTPSDRRFQPTIRTRSTRRLKKKLAKRSWPAVINCRINSPGISGSYWMADPAIGGAILGEACHFVDLMYWLLDSEPSACYRVQSATRQSTIRSVRTTWWRVSVFADGSIGNLTYCTVGSKTSGGERVEAYGPGIGLADRRFHTVANLQGVRSNRRLIWPDKGYAEQLGEFMEGIRKGRPAGVTALDGIRATVGCLRMLESARTLAPCEMGLEAALADG